LSKLRSTKLGTVLSPVLGDATDSAGAPTAEGEGEAEDKDEEEVDEETVPAAEDEVGEEVVPATEVGGCSRWEPLAPPVRERAMRCSGVTSSSLRRGSDRFINSRGESGIFAASPEPEPVPETEDEAARVCGSGSRCGGGGGCCIIGAGGEEPAAGRDCGCEALVALQRTLPVDLDTEAPRASGTRPTGTAGVTEPVGRGESGSGSFEGVRGEAPESGVRSDVGGDSDSEAESWPPPLLGAPSPGSTAGRNTSSRYLRRDPRQLSRRARSDVIRMMRERKKQLEGLTRGDARRESGR
jgi:hypothetical protein